MLNRHFYISKYNKTNKLLLGSTENNNNGFVSFKFPVTTEQWDLKTENFCFF